MPAKNRLSPHFFKREGDGSVRLRMRLSAEEAALIEEAAGETPLMVYIHHVLNERARFHIRKSNERVGDPTQDFGDELPEGGVASDNLNN